MTAAAPPKSVLYCHCVDCRRVTGAPVAAFAAFSAGDLLVQPRLGTPVSVGPGVERWFCHDCGSPVAARYDDLPGQVYVAIGLLDQAAELPPTMHSHVDSRLPWLRIDDGLDRTAGSSRDVLTARFRETEQG